MKRHVYKYNDIVIGATPTSILHAYNNMLPIIYIRPRLSYEFEQASPSRLAQQQMLYKLSLAGKVPFGSSVSSIRLNEGIMTLSIGDTSAATAEFDKAIVYDEEGIIGLEHLPQDIENRYEVLDWFSVRSGTQHPHDQIEADSDFVKCIHFYPSERIDGAPNKKDLVAVSTMTESQLESVEYTEVYVKFKVLEMMRKAKIKGPRNGFDQEGRIKYRPLRIESVAREHRKITRAICEDAKHVIFKYDKGEESGKG